MFGYLLLLKVEITIWPFAVCGLVEQSKRGYHTIDLSLYNYVNKSCPIQLHATDIVSYIISIKNLDHINCSREIKVDLLPNTLRFRNLLYKNEQNTFSIMQLFLSLSGSIMNLKKNHFVLQR